MDIEQPQELLSYLRSTGHLNPNETPHFSILAGGVSNRTVFLARSNGDQWVIKQALAHLRTEADWFSSPARIHREALGIHWLSQLTPPRTIPALVFEDRSKHILAMCAVPQPHENWKDLLMTGEVVMDYVRQFGELLAHIHRNSYLRRAEIEPVFCDRSFFKSLRLDPYYRTAAEYVPAAVPFLRALITDTLANPLCLVHGDYSPKNVLIYQGQLVLLDHEVIHWGDPAFDVGFALTHLLSKAHHLIAHREELHQAAHSFWQFYAYELSDVPWREQVEQRAVRHTVACLLARVDGRSPLEYLTEAERAAQRTAALELMHDLPNTISDLIHSFIARINHANHPTLARA